MKSRHQKAGENLQEFEIDAGHLVRLAYPTTRKNIWECLAVEAPVDGITGEETQCTLLLALPRT